MTLTRMLHYGVVIGAGEQIWSLASETILASPITQLALPYAGFGVAWIVCLADVFEFILKYMRGRKATPSGREIGAWDRFYSL